MIRLQCDGTAREVTAGDAVIASSRDHRQRGQGPRCLGCQRVRLLERRRGRTFLLQQLVRAAKFQPDVDEVRPDRERRPERRDAFFGAVLGHQHSADIRNCQRVPWIEGQSPVEQRACLWKPARHGARCSLQAQQDRVSQALAVRLFRDRGGRLEISRVLRPQGVSHQRFQTHRFWIPHSTHSLRRPRTCYDARQV